MASTSVHLPPELVQQLDRLASERGTSRNRIILQACEDLVAQHRGHWPAGFFESSLSADELDEIRTGGLNMEHEIVAARRNRAVPPL